VCALGPYAGTIKIQFRQPALLFPENHIVPRMTIVLWVKWQRLAFVPVGDFELGCSLDLFRQTFDARFAFIVRADGSVQPVKTHKPVADLNADFGVVDGFSRRVVHCEIRRA
jgi:hypothetical protein